MKSSRRWDFGCHSRFKKIRKFNYSGLIMPPKKVQNSLTKPKRVRRRRERKVQNPDEDPKEETSSETDPNGILEGILQQELRFEVINNADPQQIQDLGESDNGCKPDLPAMEAPVLQDKIMDGNEKHKKFVKENEKLLKTFARFRKCDNSSAFLLQFPHLACEETANYLVMMCINLVLANKRSVSSYVAHQCICVQYILELASQLGVPPKECIAFFFTRLQMTDSYYRDAFEEELFSFKQRILEHARKSIDGEQAEQNIQEEVLDPDEVLKTLPEELKKGFQAQDVEMLQQAIDNLPEDEAQYHMQRCIVSGLWVPGQIDVNVKKSSEEAK